MTTIKGRSLTSAVLFCCFTWGLGSGVLGGTNLARAACGDGRFDSGESCDDGNLVSGDGCSVNCRIEPRDHLLCYSIRRPRTEARSHPRVSLADRFESGKSKVRKPVMFCTAADTNQSGVLDPHNHFTCYRIRRLRGEGRWRRQTILIGNELGGRVLTAGRARTLCVPSVPVSGLFPILIPCGDGVLDPGEECDDGNTADGDGCSRNCRSEPTQRYMCRRSKETRQSPHFAGQDVEVADPLQASLMKAMESARVCAPAERDAGGVRDTTAYLECFKLRRGQDPVKPLKQEVIVENEFGTERFIVLKPRSLCVPSSEPAGLRIPERDPVRCYAANRAQGTPPFADRTVTLTDGFETKVARVVSPAEICNPADVDATGVRDPKAHLTCYNINQISGQPKFKSVDIVVHNALGTQTLTLKRAEYECVPSEIPPVAPSTGSDRLKCYSAEVTKGTPSVGTRKMKVADRFETKRTLVEQPALFCTPTDQDGEGIIDPDANLTCFSIDDAAGQPEFTKRTVSSRDQFGEITLTVPRARTLCFPSMTVFPAP